MGSNGRISTIWLNVDRGEELLTDHSRTVILMDLVLKMMALVSDKTILTLILKKKVVTLEGAINDCRVKMEKPQLFQRKRTSTCLCLHGYTSRGNKFNVQILTQNIRCL